LPSRSLCSRSISCRSAVDRETVAGLTDSRSTSSVADRLPLSVMKISARIRAAVRDSPVCRNTPTSLRWNSCTCAGLRSNE
jgi:hypothetical protein